MRQNPHVRICGGPGSATTLVYPTPVWVDAPADLGAARAERLTDNGGRRPSLAKNGRNAGKVLENCERWRVRRPEFRSPWRASRGATPTTRTFNQAQSSRCGMWPVCGSQIGNVG